MANFKIKNGLQAGRYLLNSTTLSGSTIDLSLANMFSTTLSSDPAYAFTNPPPSGTAQAFSVEVTGGTTNFTQDSFATTLYTGTGAAQTITNGLDLAGDGGIVWVKCRSDTSDHRLIDTDGGANNILTPNASSGYFNNSTIFSSFNSNGFSVATDVATNGSGRTYVSWSFKKQAKFFDIVTYTGTGAAQNISHNLGSVPGCIITKRTDASENWLTYHRGLDATAPEDKYVMLNKTNAVQDASTIWNDTAPTSTQFTVGSANTNTSGGSYVAYLFAHDTASDSRIQCGSYTGTGAEQTINLGWKAQWVIIKNTSNSAGWYIIDLKRGMTDTDGDGFIYGNANTAEGNEATSLGENAHSTAATGFKVTSNGTQINQSGKTYIYMAIRGNASTDSAITWPSSVKWPSGVAPTTPAPGTKDLFTFLTTDGGTTYYGKKAGSDIA